MAAEAVVFFDRELAANMAERRKRAGHLLSKHRFLALQIRGVSGATTAGCGWRATPTPWPTGWPRGLPPSASRRPGRSRPIWFSSCCRKLWRRGSRPPARAIMCADSDSLPARIGAGPVSDPAGDFVCHPRGRDRPIRDACRKGVKRCRKGAISPPQRRPNPRRCLHGDDAGGGNFVKRQTIYAAFAVLALRCAGRRLPRLSEPGGLPPHEILTILRSTGLDPLGQPVRRGPHYVLRAIDDTDREVSVVVSARSGDIAVGDAGSDRVADAAAARRHHAGAATSGCRRATCRRAAAIAPARRLSTRTTSRASSTIRTRHARRVRCPARRRCVRAMPRRCLRAVARWQPTTTMLRRGPSRTSITADPDRSGMLPPPPERFPQRVAPAAPPKPKPVRASSDTRRRGSAQAGAAAEAEARSQGRRAAGTAAAGRAEPAPPTAPASEETPH